MPKKKQPSTPSPKPDSPAPRKHKRGRIPGAERFKPTAEQRQLVLQAVGFQIPQDVICQLIIHPKTGLPIGETTLKLRFAEELRKGSANTRVLHAMALWKNVTAGHVTAQIWWDQTRNNIGRDLKAHDTGESAPKAKIDVDEVDIVVTARRLAFTLAQGAAKAKAAKPPSMPVKATTTSK